MVTSDLIGGGNIEPRGLEEEMRTSYLDYAMSVIVGRALPDVRDGLKPVHRRVLYAMNEAGLQPNRPYAKCARIVGEVMGKYHPHGDSAIYDTLVRLAQDFSMRNPLVDGQGNFGSVDDDPAAAMRYTEARLAPLAREMLRDLDSDTVDFLPNYDGQDREPVVLPARFPNLLVNGAAGIAVGMATNIPPHNLRETIAATIAYIDDPDLDTAGADAAHQGPGLPDRRRDPRADRHPRRLRDRPRPRPRAREGARRGGQAGQGRDRRHRAALHGQEGRRRRADPQDRRPARGEEAHRDHERRGPLGPPRHADRDRAQARREPEGRAQQALQAHADADDVRREHGRARRQRAAPAPAAEVIHHYVQHQREVIVRRSKHELRTLEAQVHRLEGLLIALDNLDAVIELIRASRDRDAARAGLIERFGLSYIQAQAILELRLSQLTALESDSIKREHADKVERIRELRELLGDEDAVLGLIKEELLEISERYGDERRTLISPAEDDLDIEDLIADQQMVIAISHSGYIKSLPLATYRQQRRGGVGITGMDLKEDDYIEHLFVCSTHDYLLFFTNRGKVYRSKVYELPEAGRTSKGRYLGNVLPLREGERVQSVLATRDFAESAYLVFGTRNGVVKKTEFQLYNTPIKADGIIAINIRDDDELVAVRRIDPGDEILMVSHAGLTVRFREEDARAMGRSTSGVRGMDVSGEDNYVLAMDVARPGQDLLVVTEAGYGKRTSIDEYRLTSRGAKGVKTITFTEAKGLLAGALVVREHQELVFISQNGIVQRTSVRGINRYGRTSQGVRVMRLRDEDAVSAVALVVESENAEQDAPPATQPLSLDADGTADETGARRRGRVRRRPGRGEPARRARGRVGRDARLRRRGVIGSGGRRAPAGPGTTEGPVDTGPSGTSCWTTGRRQLV